MKNNQKGFTIIETLIAIFILTLSITGPIYISSFAFRNTIDSRDNISAQYLSEEVIEVIKNKRDTLILSGDPWLDSIQSEGNCFNAADATDKKCILVRNTSDEYDIQFCGTGECDALSFDPLNNVVYGLSEGSAKSKFTREFYFQKGETDGSLDDIPNKEVKLVVNIKWQDRGKDKIYTLTERLYNINYVNFFKD